MCTEDDQVLPRTVTDALQMMDTALNLLTSADVHALGPGGLKDALLALGKIGAKSSAFRAAVLAAFDAAGGPEADGCKNAAAWLAYQGQVSKSAARQAARWYRALAGHPAVAGALARAEVTDSFAKLICDWTGRLPEHMRDASDAILITAAIGGCGERELQVIAARLWEESRKGQPDPDDPRPEDDRALFLDETIGGAGRLRGDLTPQCTAALRAILDALGRHRGAADTRTVPERQHDALAEALEMLLAAGGLPQRHGTPTRAEVLILFSQLRQMDGASVIEEAWLRNHTPGAPVFLTDTAAEAATCDTTLIPVVTGHPDWVIIDQIIELVWHTTCDDTGSAPRPRTTNEREELRYQIGKLALDFVSGPAGIAAVLRTGLLKPPFTAPSLPLDIGHAQTIPAWMRNAIICRDRHCQWPGGCDAPPARCDIHHIIPYSKGGSTSLANCTLMCKFHHLIAIHAWGWTLTMQAGVMRVTSPDGTTTYTSRAPPANTAA